MNQFWSDFWPHFTSIVLGLLIGLPLALWVNRVIVNAQDNYKQKQKLIPLINISTRKQFSYLIGIGILNLLLFGTIFQVFQNEKIYNSSLGAISNNYERIGEWNNKEVKNVSKPFVQMQNDNFEKWDAGIYKCISERMYTKEEICAGNYRAAFFPLFPILWKATNASPIGISIINYFIFILSVALLVISILKSSFTNKLIIYSVLITLPSVVIFYIPYSESLFILTFTIATIGIIKKKYWIYIISCFLLSMVRPATLFILIAIVLAELLILSQKRNYSLFLKEIFFKSLPFILGHFFARFIQFLGSGSWTAMNNAQKNWAGMEMQPITKISDWSFEGFGLSTFSIFFICIPLTLFIVYLAIKWNNKTTKEYVLKISNYNMEYLFIISTFYFLGIFGFTILSSGGNLHSFFRFTLASPSFYIIILIFLNYVSKNAIKLLLVAFIFMTILILVFLNSVEYGGEKISFSYFGLYMFILTALFFIIKKTLPQPMKTGITILIILLNTVWNTYLLNVFLSDGWIFT